MSLITKYRFDKKTKNEIIDEIYNYTKDEFSKGLDTDHNFIKATTLIKEIKDYNKPIELEHLLKNIKTEYKLYTNESVATVATVISTLIALAAFISPLDKVLQLYVIFVIYFFILAFLKLRVFSPRGNKLNTAIFYIEQALKETKT
ncbi:hypothetical protein [Lactococcus lactis]|uniref:Uncharacterized protein n=1 Tax=Lactococcus lactis TaxID=1358 RepID=A0A443L851_9LACT|nr:hypothetical protein [Lactococcus lactis]NYZ59599.1 hypothetical protein [Lactococcus lactis]RWR45344.1 hypothetical protein EO246_10440 [Lactococcus lactis]